MVGKTISHYKIIDKLGQGGMGEVYLGEDTKLDRKVALKFLPDLLHQDPVAEKRFLREAKSAAALDHPFICNIYEAGEEDGRSFISMEYVQGATLKDKLEDGSLALKDALEIATEIAEALETAHKENIVHRDLKPSNIMLTPDGHVKVMDFGLAKRMVSAETLSAGLTASGVAVGTLAYMSPEQLRGQDLDTRSDIFSFGIVLFEMLTGIHPFKKPEPMEMASAILTEDPPPLSLYLNEVPSLLQHTVKKMLAKEPDRRYQSIHEVKINLKDLISEIAVSSGTQAESDSSTVTARPQWVGRFWPAMAIATVVVILLALALFVPPTFAPGEAIGSIAVLPFENLSNDPDVEYLSDGTAQSIIYSLSQLSEVKVISFSSVQRYKEQDTSFRQVAEELGVRAVLRGRLNQRGDNLSINVELVDTEDDSVLWGEQYNRELTEILAVQEDIAKEISENLRLQLSGEDQRQLTKQYTQNTEAYQAYLRGRYHWNKRTKEGFETAVRFFDEAIYQDPSYAQAYAGLADAYSLMAFYGHRPLNEGYSLARAAAERSLEIDNRLAEAHASLAYIQMFYDWDWDECEAGYKRGIELNPNYATAHHGYGLFLQIQGQLEEALVEFQKALALDPLSLEISRLVGATLYNNRRYEEAIDQLQKTLEMEPNFLMAHRWLTFAYWQSGMHEEAIVQAEKVALLGGNNFSKLPMFLRQVASDNRLEALRTLENWEVSLPLERAAQYALLGEADQAIEWLNKAVEERFPPTPIALRVDPFLDPLRDDPRFQDLLRRVNLEP